MSIETELETLKKKGGGRITPAAVVDFAFKNKKSALGSRFNWDLKAAAREHWLKTARDIIRVHVVVLDRGDGKPVPMAAHVAAPPAARRGGNAGYGETKVILSASDTRASLLETVLNRLEAIYNSYPLVELLPVKRAIDEVRAKASPKTAPKAKALEPA